MRVRLKGINTVRKRRQDGSEVVYRYLGKGGPRLEGEPGSPEFMASYYAAAATAVQPRRDQLNYLFDEYMKAPEFTDLKPSTRKHYTSRINAIIERFGDMPIKLLKDRAVRRVFLEWRDEVGKTAPRQADLGIAVFARVLAWAFHEGLAPAHPLERTRRLHRGNRRDKIWSEEDEARFYDKAPEHFHLPVKLALWTGQRRGDLLALTWASYDGARIRFLQGKTGARVSIPVAEKLKYALDAAKVRLDASEEALQSQPILTNSYGEAWSDTGFSASWRKACQAAEIEGLTFHDLRGTAVTRLARAGCTVPEIASITGHKMTDVHAILQTHYLHLDDEIADAAIKKLEAYSPNQTPNSQPRRAWKSKKLQ